MYLIHYNSKKYAATKLLARINSFVCATRYAFTQKGMVCWCIVRILYLYSRFYRLAVELFFFWWYILLFYTKFNVSEDVNEILYFLTTTIIVLEAVWDVSNAVLVWRFTNSLILFIILGEMSIQKVNHIIK